MTNILLELVDNSSKLRKNRDNFFAMHFATALLFVSQFVINMHFYARKQLLLSARFSHRNSVCLSVTRVDQSKTVQARITKFLLSLPKRL